MSPPTKQRQYELLRRALAMVEERGSVPLTETATAVGVTPDELRRLLYPVLFLEYYTADGTHVGEERAFLLTEQGFLKVDERHWLRDLETEPPSPDAALRLLIAGEIVRALGLDGSSELEDALKKLRGVVAMALRLDIEQPALRDIALGVLRGHSATELANEFEISPVTVRTRLMRIRTSLRRQLAAYLDETGALKREA